MSASDTLRIGIVGAENTHAGEFAKGLNLAKLCPGAEVSALWGETPGIAQEVAARTGVPIVVNTPEEMLEHVDAIMVAHRNGDLHAPVARHFIEAGLPVFIDKPLTRNSAEVRELILMAKEKAVAITSFSVIPLQKSFVNIRRTILSHTGMTELNIEGHCTFHSPYGGVFFYGIHQVAMILELVEDAIIFVSVEGAESADADGVVTMKTRKDGPTITMRCKAHPGSPFNVSACGTDWKYAFGVVLDRQPYATGIGKVVEMFRTGEMPYSTESMLRPIVLLEAIDKAWREKRQVEVPPIDLD